MYKIFVSIACFMDKDIINTIEDCLKKAEHPKNIVFGLCIQYDPQDNFIKNYENNPQFKIHKMNWKDARGPAYARGIIYDLFQDEDYFFQIDCHTRFFQNWDTKIIDSLNLCKKINNKSIISHYPISIDNSNNVEMLSNIINISIVRTIDINHGIKTHGRYIPLNASPKSSWGISAAMLFFDKTAYKEILFDKNIYNGLQFEEQVVLAARYWTAGYDIFNPNNHIISTEYITNTKRYNVSPQTDHVKKKETYERLCHMMKLNFNNKYINHDIKLGNSRTIEDYYKMLGIYEKVKTIFTNNYLEINEKKVNSISIGSVGGGYSMSSYFINYIFNLSYPNKILIQENSEDADVIIYTHFTRFEDFWNNTSKPFLLWNGESYNIHSNIKNCSYKCIVSSLEEDNGELKIPYAFHAYIEYVKRGLWLKYKKLYPINKRKKLFGYCISADRGPNIRKDFIENVTNYTTDSYSLGRYKNTKSITYKVDGKWNDEKLQEKYAEFKFIFAAENKVKSGYITEKIINAFSSGAIPIYLGDSKYAKTIFNSKSFICVDDFTSYDECVKYISNLSEEQIQSYSNEPIFTDNIESEIFREVDNTFSIENNKIIKSIHKLMSEQSNDIIYDKIIDKIIDKNIIQSVIINLKKDQDKYSLMSKKLTHLEIPHKRFDAILGTDIYEQFKTQKRFLNNGYNLRPHQVGIWQSHYIIWKQMIDENINKLLIFEDDCSFVNDFKVLYNNVLDMVKDKNYDILFLGYSGASIDIENNLYLLKNQGVPRTTHSYILTLSGAKKLVEELKVIDFPIDEIIGKMFNNSKLIGFRTSYLLTYQPWQLREDKYPLPSRYINKYQDLI